MFCPNCGQDCGEARFCSECGQDLRRLPPKNKEDHPETQQPLDLEEYYQKYKPDRLQAIMALRIDTGMSPMQAQEMIDAVFDEQEKEACVSEVAQQNTKRETPGFTCPHCMATEIKTQPANTRRKRIYARHCYGNSAVKLVASVLDISSAIISYRNRNNLEHTCRKCGYQWQSRQE